MKPAGLFILLLLLIPFCLAAEQQFEVSLHYQEEKLSLNYILVTPSLKEISLTSQGEYKAEIIDHKNSKLHESNFPIMTISGVDFYNLNEDFIRDDFDLNLTLPYFPEAKTLNIYNQNNTLLLAVDLSPYAQREYFLESQKSPPEKESIPIQKEADQTAKEGFPKEVLIAGAVFAVIMIFLLFLAFRVRKTKTI